MSPNTLGSSQPSSSMFLRWWILRPGNAHLTARRECLVDYSYLTLPPVPSSVVSVAAAEWPEDLLSTLMAQEPLESVDPSTGTSTPDSD